MIKRCCFFLITLLFILCGCTSARNDLCQCKINKEEIIGQASQNNCGVFYKNESWIYGPFLFLGENSERRTYSRTSEINSQDDLLNNNLHCLIDLPEDEQLYSLTESNGFFYFSSYTTNQANIYTMTQGGSCNVLVPNACGKLQLVDNCLYYNNLANTENWQNDLYSDSSNAHLYCYNISGKSEVTEIIPFPTRDFHIFGNKILSCTDTGDGFSLYIYDLDGEHRTRLLSNVFIRSPIYDGKYIYYLCAENAEQDDAATGYLYKVTPDGKNPIKISNCLIRQFFLLNDTIYYTDANESNFLYCMNDDGTNPKIIVDSYCAQIQLLSDENHIAYKDCYSNSYHIINLLGTNQVEWVLRQPYGLSNHTNNF